MTEQTPVEQPPAYPNKPLPPQVPVDDDGTPEVPVPETPPKK